MTENLSTASSEASSEDNFTLNEIKQKYYSSSLVSESSVLSEVQKYLNDLNFYTFENSLDLIAKNIESEFSRIEEVSLNSFIPSKDAPTKQNLILTIDIGGTSTKAGIRVCDGNQEKWIYLFEIRNLALELEDKSTHSFKLFCEILAKEVSQGLEKYNIKAEDIHCCGFVWSNPAINKVCDQGKNILGISTQKKMWSKGEWFLDDLEDDENLNQYFLGAFNQYNINPRHIVISNDTVLTFKVSEKANAGIVASTGLNCTVLKDVDGSSLIFNSESGNHYSIPEEFLTEADHLEGQTLNIQSITAGKFLPLLLMNYVKVLSSKGITELSELARHYSSLNKKQVNDEIRSRDLSLLIRNTSEDIAFFLERREKPDLYSKEVLSILRFLAVEIVYRAGQSCGLLLYLSIVNQLDSNKLSGEIANDNEQIVFSLDSRLSREIPLYFDCIKQTLDNVLPGSVDYQISLCKPLELDQGSISVPMLGMANAIDSFLA